MSQQIYFLDSDNVYICNKESDDCYWLKHNIPNLSFILYYSNNCPHCENMLSIMQSLPTKIQGIQMAIFNVSTDANKQVVLKSIKTNTPLKYVPYMLFYVNGKPYVQYTGEYKLDNILSFLNSVLKSLDKPSNTFETVSIPKKVTNGSTFGQPLCSNKVCFLTMDMAYNTS